MINASPNAAAQRVLDRLDAISISLQKETGTQALIGLGSVGNDRQRLDAYSDIDFFVIVDPGCKSKLLENLNWLERTAPIGFAFRNTQDGYKVLFQDELFCEFAVFEPQELRKIPFSEGRVIWKRKDVSAQIAVPEMVGKSVPEPYLEWHIGELLTNLYVGLLRYLRGEKLSAYKFIQNYAVDRLAAIISAIEQGLEVDYDPFAPERRVEVNSPCFANLLPAFIQGYEKSPESAHEILEYLQSRVPLNSTMTSAIKKLLVQAKTN